ncbi:MAG TPA: ABC transporter ATP-binding protein [Sporosarcina sp.]|nr:ABC transporter ATP-binding protein [Sporosarcina sp.]
MTPVVTVKDFSLRFEFAERDTLSGVSFSLERAESILVLGPSGCGKSTLTLCLNGLYPRELDGSMSGEILINGKPTTTYEPGQLSRHVGVVFQDPETQFCMLTVEDEVAFGLENIGVPHEEMEDRIDQALQLVNMQEFKQAMIATLSGGQKQKLALACILALEPEVLILDEPTANLDPIARIDVIQTIKRLKDELGLTMLIIEHQLDQWTDLADRCLLFNQTGTIFFDGSLREAIRTHLPKIKQEGIWLPNVAQYVLPYVDPATRAIPLSLEEFACQAHVWNGIEWNQRERNGIQTKEKVSLETKNVSFSVGEKPILRNISLTLHENEFVAIVGANGSGKTTLSRVLAGLQKPTKGSVTLHGKPLHSWREADLRNEIGYVFQNPEHQFITNTVYEEVAFSLQIKGVPENEVHERVTQILERYRLAAYVDEHPYTLSQGQKRRLSLATMLVDNQKMLLLDEPTFGQDAATNLEMMNMLQDRFEVGTTIVMITHDMELVHKYVDRIIVLNKGTVVADCTPEELWDMPDQKLYEWGLDLPIPVKMQRYCEKEDHYVLTST